MNICRQRLQSCSRAYPSLFFSRTSSPINLVRAFCSSQSRYYEKPPTPGSSAQQTLHAKSVYPRIGEVPLNATCDEFVRRYENWDQNSESSSSHIVHGRVSTIRSSGSKLLFIDIVGDNVKVQGVCNLRLLDGISKGQIQSIGRGGIVRLTGAFTKTSSGRPSILLQKPPELLTPCLQPPPVTEILDQEILISKKHLGFLVNQESASLIRAKSQIIQSIRTFLLEDDHIEVQTPILADAAGGAVARPFRTESTEFVGRELALRIAPELWLKRMVVGGFDRVFEIGPSFRNEGIDLTHNPEFTTCEFYRAYTNLDGLIDMTERIFSQISDSLSKKDLPGLDLPKDLSFSGPYKRIDFITGIEAAIGRDLPSLSDDNAFQELKDLVSELNLPIQITETMNLPQILDKLCSEYLESQCVQPTFIINHPVSMSPLAKSHPHPTKPYQTVAARAELFVNSSELANMYEEENSPIEQRAKFIQQLSYKDDDGNMEVDEAYLEALECGLPPVGGWGCGIERLTMAMTGSHRIGDVLSFGTLRNVVSKHRRS